ncbi:MAG TPA: hypothetical protein PLF40_13925 [Kofleriaceae bacterium]|nr:hypothetical protein [Kofleriaceae bacterium]
MKRLNAMTLLLIVALPLAGCGGTDFTGTYMGSIARTDTRTAATTSKAETWVIADGANANLVRKRDAEQCTLKLETGTCSEGCYNQVILAGQQCIFGGETFTLEAGVIKDGNVSDDDYTISTSWRSAAGVAGAVVESGTLTRQ